jgi:hypothetical protein
MHFETARHSRPFYKLNQLQSTENGVTQQGRREKGAASKVQRTERRGPRAETEEIREQIQEDLEERVKAHEKGAEVFRHYFSIKSCGYNGVNGRYEAYDTEGIAHRNDGLGERQDNFFQRLDPLE